MKCIVCSTYSFSIICKVCQDNFLKPELRKKELLKNLFFYYFYSYDEIKELIYTKYDSYGAEVFKILANNSIKKFQEEFCYNNSIYAVPIENKKIEDFSHTAILANALTNSNIKLYRKLKAQNIVKYANMDLEFRLKNKRDFKYSGKKDIEVILVDDIITTGSTIKEAKMILSRYNIKVLFAISLTYAGEE